MHFIFGSKNPEEKRLDDLIYAVNKCRPDDKSRQEKIENLAKFFTEPVEVASRTLDYHTQQFQYGLGKIKSSITMLQSPEGTLEQVHESHDKIIKTTNVFRDVLANCANKIGALKGNIPDSDYQEVIQSVKKLKAGMRQAEEANIKRQQALESIEFNYHLFKKEEEKYISALQAFNKAANPSFQEALDLQNAANDLFETYSRLIPDLEKYAEKVMIPHEAEFVNAILDNAAKAGAIVDTQRSFMESKRNLLESEKIGNALLSYFSDDEVSGALHEAISFDEKEVILTRLEDTKSLTLSELTSYANKLGEPLGAVLTRCPHLSHLDLHGINREQLPGLLAYPIAGLTSLSLWGCSNLEEHDIKDIIAAFPQLTDLDVSGCGQLREPSFRFIGSLSHLTSLNIAGCWINDERFLALTKLPLTSLNLADCISLTNITFSFLPRNFPQLTSLNLERISSFNLNSGQLKALADALPGCRIIISRRFFG